MMLGHLKVRKAYMPRVKKLIAQKKQQEAMGLLLMGNTDYAGQLMKFISPLPMLDTALMIATLEHIAAEFRRLDPQSAILCDMVKRMSVFPPMVLRTMEKKGERGGPYAQHEETRGKEGLDTEDPGEIGGTHFPQREIYQ